MLSMAEEDFDAGLLGAEGLVLVDFWADWCGPCGVVGPILEGLEPDYQGRVEFWKVDADQNRRLMDAFGVRSLPSVVLLEPHHDGGARVIGHVVGAQGAQTFIELLERGLNPKPSFFARFLGVFGGASNG